MTGQPDWGSVELQFEGPKLDPAGVLALVLAQREHNGFHEATVERLYGALEALPGSTYVAVRAAYCRRGGHRYHPLPGLGTNVLQSPAPCASVIGSRARRAATISPCRSRVMG